MRPKASLILLTPLLSQPSFTAKEAKNLGISAAVLSHYIKSGQLHRIRHGVYQATNYQNPKSFRWADLIKAVLSINGAVICLISALAVYDLTEELPRQHWIGIRHGTSARSNRQTKIIRFRDLELGKTEIKLEIVDAFRLFSRETAIKALKMAIKQGGKNRIDLIKLEAYAKQLHVDITPYLLSITT